MRACVCARVCVCVFVCEREKEREWVGKIEIFNDENDHDDNDDDDDDFNEEHTFHLFIRNVTEVFLLVFFQRF